MIKPEYEIVVEVFEQEGVKPILLIYTGSEEADQFLRENKVYDMGSAIYNNDHASLKLSPCYKLDDVLNLILTQDNVLIKYPGPTLAKNDNEILFSLEASKLENINQLASIYSLVAEMSAINVQVEGMKAANQERLSKNEAIAYDECFFTDAEIYLNIIVDKLTTIAGE